MLSKIIYKTLRIPGFMDIEVSTPKDYQATLIFIHGIGMSKQMWRQIERHFKADCQIIKVDLLGFGKSNNPKWLKYSLKDQATSLFLTLFKKNKLLSLKPTILIGHSLGSLVAAEFAHRYSFAVNNLVLLSPPIYLRHSSLKEKLLRKYYQSVLDSDQLLAASVKIGQKFFNYSTTSDPQSKQAFAKTLRTAIMRQNVFAKLAATKTPTNIIYGIFDPVIVADNFKPLADINPNVTIDAVWGTHDLKHFLSSKAIYQLKLLTNKAGR